MVTDHLSDFVIRIKNGYRAGAATVLMPPTKTVEKVAVVLVKSGYLAEAKTKDGILEVTLKYAKKTPALRNIERVSKQGARIYSGIKSLPRVWGGLGVNILSTPRGIMSDKEAKKLHVGGEVLCRVW